MRSARPASLVRRLGKFGLFLARAHSPQLAWWLAAKDATRGQSYHSLSRAALLAASGADPSWSDLASADGHIRSKTLGLEFVGDDLVSRGYATWLELSALGWKFERTPSGSLLARRQSLTLHLTTDEECSMIREIHLAGCYDLRLPGDWDVVDIGANVGMAALFFADAKWCRRVVCYEPFEPTAAAFEQNIRLNPDLAGKISLIRMAVGESDEKLMVEYNADLRGSMSITGLGEWRGQAQAPARRESITVARASVALAPVFAALGSRRLLGKIDCEGSEYGIFRELEASGAIEHFSAFIIEWHARGPGEINDMLLRHGFTVHVSPLSADHHTLGLIYATRLPAQATK